MTDDDGRNGHTDHGRGGGIGRGVAKLFLEEGGKVVLMGRSVERLEEAKVRLGASEESLLLFPGDVALAPDCKAVVDMTIDAWGRIDTLINAAAIDDEADFLDMTEEGWDAVLDVNLKGPFLLSQEVAKVMIPRVGGRSSTSAQSITRRRTGLTQATTCRRQVSWASVAAWRSSWPSTASVPT